MDGPNQDILIQLNEIDFGEHSIELGIGSTSAVFEATLTTDNKETKVAVKMYQKIEYKEVNILKDLGHKNIIKFYGLLNHRMKFGIVLELASEGNLGQFLARFSQESKDVGLPSRLPKRQFVQWSIDLASAVQYLHEKKIIHKDIKSSNCLLSDDQKNGFNVLKLCDFGISKQVETTIIATSGGCTKRWSSPEVIEYPTMVSKKSDMFSLGVVKWELWTCDQPWKGVGEFEMSMNIVKGILLVLPKDFPDELRPMMKQCWKKKREERCDIDEVLDYLENFRNSINETPKHPHQSCSLSDDKGSKTENDDENQPSSYNKEVTSEPIEVENRPVNMDSPQKGYEVLTVKEDLTLIDQPSFSKDDSSIPTGKLREEISKLYKHIEGSCLSLKQVMEEFFDKRRCHEFLSVGERRHLMINIVEVEQSISSLYDWFKTCQWRIPTVCGLITNIFDYLQPIANFAVYSHVQMNMIESIRRCTDNGGSLADDEDANTLTFTDVQTILMKQANWLKKFQCIIQGIQSALTAKMTKEESVIDEFKQCCNKLKEMVDNCNDHENRIINKMEDHITSLVPKLQFTAEEEEEKKAQKLMVYGECWVQKKGDVTVLESTKRGKKRLIEKRKCTIIAFVNTFLIVQPNIDVFEVDDCIHKKDIQVERGGYENVDKNFGMEEIKNETGERVKLTKLDPYSRHSVQNYILYFEDRSEISEWLKVLKFSERESLAQEVEYITPLGIMNEAKEQPTSEDQVSSGMEQNDHEVKILFDIADLNKKNIKSLSKLNELYINDAAFNKILEEGEKHHLYRNVTEVKDMVESFDSVLESNRRDSVVYFTELNNRLKEGSFRPIVKYRANMCFQQNMLEFQRKHRTTFIDVLEKCERTQSGISLMDLEARLMKPLDWLTCLHKKSKALNSSATCTMFEHDQLQTETIKRLEHFIQEDQEMTKSIERKKSSHMTSVLLDLQIPSPRDHQLLQKLLNIKDDWLNKHGCFTLYRKGDVLKKGMRKKYPTMKESIHIYASTSVIIMNSKQLCKCYDRNYADIESVNTRNRKGWMHEKGFLFKLWIYERVSQNDDYQPVEHLLRYTSESDQIVKDFMKWKVALVVSTGESGKYDDYTRPRHIISKPFTTDRDNELELEVNDFVELLEHREAIGQVWVKGIRYERDGMSGWFPRDRLGPERSSEYSIGQKIKLRFKNERENKGDRRHSHFEPEATSTRSKKSTKDRLKRFSLPSLPFSFTNTPVVQDKENTVAKKNTKSKKDTAAAARKDGTEDDEITYVFSESEIEHIYDEISESDDEVYYDDVEVPIEDMFYNYDYARGPQRVVPSSPDYMNRDKENTVAKKNTKSKKDTAAAARKDGTEDDKITYVFSESKIEHIYDEISESDDEVYYDDVEVPIEDMFYNYDYARGPQRVVPSSPDYMNN